MRFDFSANRQIALRNFIVPENQNYFVTVATGLESILEKELQSLGVEGIKAVGSGVYFNGSLEDAYRVCLWSRVANRVLLPLAEFPAGSPEELYSEIRKIDWSEHMDVDGTLAVEFFSSNSNITHTQYGALKVKDAVVDQFREKLGVRPSVDRQTPSIRINVYVFRNKARLSLDLAGMSLHRRGYRDSLSLAPLKENLAAALLLASDWPARAKRGESFCDPMCGSGTFLIEAAMMAADIAPQLKRAYFGFSGWKQHQSELWKTIREEAHARAEAGLAAFNNEIRGSDKSTHVVELAKANIERIGLKDVIQIAVGNIEQIHYPSAMPAGLAVINPPYGVRLEDNNNVGSLYGSIGRCFKNNFGNWTVGIFTGSPDLVNRMRLKTSTALKCSNGGIDCKLILADVPESQTGDDDDTAVDSVSEAAKVWASATPGKLKLKEKKPERAEMFANRLRKNAKQLLKWAANEDIGCYRIYDADLPEYALAIDVYESDHRYVHVQEYRAPANIDKAVAQKRLETAIAEIPDVLECSAEDVRLKERKRQTGTNQYEKLNARGGADVHIIEEGGLKFEVNLSDYLDTGIFSDHRKIRQWIAKQAKGGDFLNLFAYTGTASVYAAKGGAETVTTVDMSANYLSWAERNMALNDLSSVPHELIRTDCLEWLAGSHEKRYDLILLDPPTFSNSTRMEQDWEVQRDHVKIIRQAMRLLKPDGLLIFSNNYRKFKMDNEKLDRYRIENKTRASIPRDFSRRANIHQCYFIQHTPVEAVAADPKPIA